MTRFHHVGTMRNGKYHIFEIQVQQYAGFLPMLSLTVFIQIMLHKLLPD